MIALCFGFIGKVSALISSVPSAVMGGVSFLLFGIIASSGLRMLIDNNIDYENKRNLIITSVILVIGVGGLYSSIKRWVPNIRHGACGNCRSHPEPYPAACK